MDTGTHLWVPPFTGGLASPAAGNAVIRQAQLSVSSGLVSAAEGWVPKVIPILWLLHPLGKVERLGQLRPKGDNCEGHCGSCVSCGVYRWASLLPLPCPVSFLSPPLGMVPVTLCGKHSVPKLFSESASWEAHPVPAPTTPVFQRLAEQPVPEGLFSELHNHTTFGLSGIWVRLHLEPPLGSFQIHSPRGQGMAGSGVKPEFLGPSH